MPIEPVPGTDRQVRNPSQDACKDRGRSRVFGIVSLRTARVLGTSDCARNALVWGVRFPEGGSGHLSDPLPGQANVRPGVPSRLRDSTHRG